MENEKQNQISSTFLGMTPEFVYYAEIGDLFVLALIKVYFHVKRLVCEKIVIMTESQKMYSKFIEKRK